MAFTRFNKIGIGYGAVVEYTEPGLAASTTVASTYTVTGLTTNSICIFSPRTALPGGLSVPVAYCANADELTLLWSNETASTKGGAASTGRGYLTAFEIPSTGPVYSS